MVESAYRCFATLDESVGLGEHQQLLTSQKEMTRHHVPRDGRHTANCHLAKGAGPAFDQASGAAANGQEMQRPRPEQHAKRPCAPALCTSDAGSCTAQRLPAP